MKFRTLSNPKDHDINREVCSERRRPRCDAELAAQGKQQLVNKLTGPGWISRQTSGEVNKPAVRILGKYIESDSDRMTCDMCEDEDPDS